MGQEKSKQTSSSTQGATMTMEQEPVNVDKSDPQFAKKELVINIYKPLSPAIQRYHSLEKLTIQFNGDSKNWISNATNLEYVNRNLVTLNLYLDNPCRKKNQGFEALCNAIQSLIPQSTLQNLRLSMGQDKQTNCSQDVTKLIESVVSNLSRLYLICGSMRCEHDKNLKAFTQALIKLPKSIYFLFLVFEELSVSADGLKQFIQSQKEILQNKDSFELIFRRHDVESAPYLRVIPQFLNQIPNNLYKYVLDINLTQLDALFLKDVIDSLSNLPPLLEVLSVTILSTQQNNDIEKSIDELTSLFIENVNRSNLTNLNLHIGSFRGKLENGVLFVYNNGAQFNFNKNQYLDFTLQNRFNLPTHKDIPPNEMSNLFQEKATILLHLTIYEKLVQQILSNTAQSTPVKYNFWDLYV